MGSTPWVAVALRWTLASSSKRVKVRSALNPDAVCKLFTAVLRDDQLAFKSSLLWVPRPGFYALGRGGR
jgi:hypothetical protein